MHTELRFPVLALTASLLGGWLLAATPTAAVPARQGAGTVLVCQHAQRSGRAGHFARRGDLRDRQ